MNIASPNEAKQQEEKEKTEAPRMVSGAILNDDWEAANRRRLEHRAAALITAQRDAIEELAREYEDT